MRSGRWQDVLADVEACDAVITDPPYSERTHSGQLHGRKDPRYHPSACLTGRGLPYDKWAPVKAEVFATTIALRCSGWFVAFTSHDLVSAYTAGLEAAGRYVFAPLACVQIGMNVRLAGDGPSNWTTWLVVSRPRCLPYSKWGTLPGAYVGGQDQDRKRGVGIVGGKPLWLMRAIVRDYTRPGDLVVDPCAGGGTTLLAAVIEGRRAIGAEMDPDTYAKAVRRLQDGFTPDMYTERPAELAGEQEPLL